MSNLNEEVSIKLIGKITLLLPMLEQKLDLQLEIKRAIDETLYNYDVQTKCTDLITSDIEEKAALYRACKKLEGLSPKTLENYRLFLEKLEQFYTKPCGTITTMDLRMFLAVLGKGKQQSTINGYITMLKAFFGWLQNEEYIIRNPAAKLKSTKVPKVILQGYKAENLEKLREACITEKEKCLFELLDSTACRISELDEIKIEDINFTEQSLIVTGKGNKQRIVYFSTKAKLHIKAYIGKRTSGYLFVSDKSPHQHIRVRALQLILSKIKKRTEVTERVRCHKFRRTQATYLLNSGMTIQGVQKILGHTSPDTTQRYAQLSQENLRNEYRRLVV
ncbi:tyrosine-type recombinase/integrase [Clostridium beijerinckii]|uniref:tyrosine-type recombinase/integrase n=1 Tax=Clostridium beijerinckii TaxID=1520 RepID=UPI001361E27C|nr:tyrosine-type recombinase/integrase [Clostridium beijerinckii]MZK53483.1 tyrosine-type recombinase/integrase [Clostridium beijerinckii]MZK61621.1 tyrosine-type recombinase/integrase [Clostridium beijerinckii]MZK71846.1 tyrosine-type recombinase/integrase [Clostridium beijerinckii]MZK77250.1 tyrosine-type recombinase/integrase [Clostridium beijerinckii]MZK86329.1 tyrosine-type recombinase/integrase [Clostridium beijerinckii]